MVELTYDYLATRVCVHAEENNVMERYDGYQTLEFWKRFVESFGPRQCRKSDMWARRLHSQSQPGRHLNARS